MAQEKYVAYVGTYTHENSVGTVSYTPLDVYKRQALHPAATEIYSWK